MATVKRKNVVGEKPAEIPAQPPTPQLVDNLGNALEGQGKTILYVLGALILLGIAAYGISVWQSRTAAVAQTALGKAIETHNAQVSASPIPNSTTPVFATEKERAEKSIAAFEEVANKFGSPTKEKAQYFVAVNRLRLDRAAGVAELEALAKNSNSEVANLSKFAVAEAKFADGKYDEAAALYAELAKQSNPIFALETLNYSLATVYAKQEKKEEAANLYFDIAKNAREAKDAEGKPSTLSQTARDAARELEKLDAAKFATLPPEPVADIAGGGMPF